MRLFPSMRLLFDEHQPPQVCQKQAWEPGEMGYDKYDFRFQISDCSGPCEVLVGNGVQLCRRSLRS